MMDLLSFNSLRTTPSSSLSGARAAIDKHTSFFAQSLAFPTFNNARNACSHQHFRLPKSATVSAQVTTGSSAKTSGATKQDNISKDEDLAFVAGTTGRVGSRTVRELLKLGFRVRAGVRSAQKAEALVQSVRQMKLDGANGGLETQPVEKLEIVECDLENKSSIGPAIGKASVVICCIGASEKEVFDVTGPYRIDYQATKNLIEAATVAQVDHFILLTSLGTGQFGLPASLLNLFWGVLCWKRRAEEALISSGLPYTIVRPGGMERPTDSFKETHNLVLAKEDTYFGGLVSNLQVAELIAVMAKNKRLSYCKVVEVIAETTAPLTPMEELLARIPPQQRELPPSSPTPTPSTGADYSKQKIEEPVQAKLDTTISSPEPEPAKAPIPKTYHLSPYMAYADLKPPTSPTPSVPSTTEPVIPATSAIAENSNPEHSGASHQKKLGPLSPYTMYADLKPPSSPTPSVPS